MFKCCMYLLGISSTWPDCGIRFRRITELIEVDPQLEVLIPPATELSTLKLPRIGSENPQMVVPEPEDDPADFRRVQLIKKTFQPRINPDSTTGTEYAPSEESVKGLNVSLEHIASASEAFLGTEEERWYVSSPATCFKLAVLPSLLLTLYRQSSVYRRVRLFG
jgi:hypothetical protein